MPQLMRARTGAWWGDPASDIALCTSPSAAERGTVLPLLFVSILVLSPLRMQEEGEKGRGGGEEEGGEAGKPCYFYKFHKIP